MKNIFAFDSAVSYQEDHWKLRKRSVDMSEENALPFITISREYGCLGYAVGEALAELLNTEHKHEQRWDLYDRNLLDRLMDDMHLSRELAETLTSRAQSSMADYLKNVLSDYPPEVMVYEKLIETIRTIAANGHAIIIGRVGNVITRDMPRGFHVRLVAGEEKKIDNLSKLCGLSRQEAKKVLAEKGDVRDQFILKRLKVDITDPHLYDLVINATRYSGEGTARLIIPGIRSAAWIRLPGNAECRRMAAPASPLYSRDAAKVTC